MMKTVDYIIDDILKIKTYFLKRSLYSYYKFE